MKKIKLLVPILLSITTSCGLLPLVSCSKFDGTVTEDEWKEALGYLCGYSKEELHWSYSKGDEMTVFNEGEDSVIKITDWVINKDGIRFNKEEIDKTQTEKEINYSKFIGPFEYQFGQNEKHYCIMPKKDKSSFYYTILVILSTLYEYKNVFSFQNDKYYHYSGSLDETIFLETKISFSSNKKVSHFETTAIINDEEEGKVTLKINIHFNYDDVGIEWPQELLERISKHSFILHQTANFDTSIDQQESEGLMLCISPNNTYNTLTAYKDSTSIDMFYFQTIYKNGVELEENAEDGYSINNGVITFNIPVTTSDSVYMKFEPSLNDGEYTFKLENK